MAFDKIVDEVFSRINLLTDTLVRWEEKHDRMDERLRKVEENTTRLGSEMKAPCSEYVGSVKKELRSWLEAVDDRVSGDHDRLGKIESRMEQVEKTHAASGEKNWDVVKLMLAALIGGLITYVVKTLG